MNKSSATKTVILGLLVLSILVLLTGCLKVPGSDNTDNSFEDDFGDLEEGLNETDSAVNETVKVADKTKEVKAVEKEETADETEPAAETGSKIPVKTVIEGETVSFPNLKAKDPEGASLTYTFSEPLDKNGQWRTEKGDAGEYTVTITVSDGQKQTSQQVKILVKSLNKAPVLTLDKAEYKVKEGEVLLINATATDADGDDVTITYAGLVNSSKTVLGFDAAGTHQVVITASDGKEKVSKNATVVVENVDRAPRIDKLDIITVKEGERVVVKPTVVDADGDKVKLTFTKPLNEDGEWQTSVGDAGSYDASVTASDGTLINSENVKIVVKSSNQPPVIKLDKSTMSVDEGATIELNPIVTDPEGDQVDLKYSGWMKTNTKKTTYEDGGTHVVIITADDGHNIVEMNLTIVVREVNRPPVFDDDAFS